MKDEIYLVDRLQNENGSVTVYRVDTKTGSMEPLPNYLHEVNHSPDGFNVGYGGSGPMQLAYALCRDLTEDRKVAEMAYRHVCGETVAKIPRGGIHIITPDVLIKQIMQVLTKACPNS